MATILIVVLGLAVIISAVAAERSARSHRRFRAVCLNLFGIGCLGAGLIGLYTWSHGGVVVLRQVAMAASEAHAGSMAALLWDDNQSATPALPEEPAAPTAESATPDASVAPESTAPTNELTAEATDEQSQQGNGSELSLPELMKSQIEIDYAARPAWVDREDRDEGPVHMVSVAAGPYPSQRQSRRELGVELKRVTDEYINDLLDSGTAAHWIDYDLARIRQSLVAQANYYDEKVISPSVGVMYQSHALLEFGPEFHRDVERTWQQIVVRARLVKVAMAAAAILGTLALLFSYFQADTATRGFYTGRLKFVTFVAILGLIAAGFFLARSIPWLWP